MEEHNQVEGNRQATESQMRAQPAESHPQAQGDACLLLQIWAGARLAMKCHVHCCVHSWTLWEAGATAG